MKLEKHIAYYEQMRKRLKAYHYANWVLNWDMETETPSGAFEYRSEQIEVLSNEIYQLETDTEYLDAIEYMHAHLNELPELLRSEIKQSYKQLRLVKVVPKKEYIDYQVLLSQSGQIWAEARKNDDFEAFLPTLEKILTYNRKLVKYLETPTLKGYDVLLDMYEEGYTTKEYDAFFDRLKEDLVEFVLKATTQRKASSKKLTKGFFDKDKQKVFSEYLLDVFYFDRKHGLLKESAHPFSSNASSTDVRITTRYLENLLPSSIFSTIHELGHAIYEQQIDKKFLPTFIGNGASLGIHESQSRMYENMIGRSYAFWEAHYPKLKEIFPKELKQIDLLDFHQHINTAKRSLIRVEADELTYPLHIMARYEIEKLLINGKLKAKDLPKKWRLLYQKYVGVRPKNDSDGVLQDVHWSFGLIGYFPTYALGSAYAAQIYQAMNKEINVENAVSDNHIDLLNAWLKDKIHQYGSSKTPKELLLNATGEDFNPSYYIEYLKRKFAY